MISALLLAAGESKRMGAFKQLLPLGDKSFVEHCVDNLLSSRVDEVIVIVGHRESEVRSKIADRPARLLYNHDYLSGMASSIKCGVEAISTGARACVIALVDQPRVGPDLIDRLIETYEKEQPLIVVPTYEGKNGHPVIIDLSIKDEILTMDPGKGLREIVRKHSNRIRHVEVPGSAVVEDCDLPEEYARMLNK